MGMGTFLLFGALSVVNASAATPNHGKRLPDKAPVISGPLVGNVNVDDVLRIDVDAPGLSGSYRVDPTGGIDYPFVGRLTVSGLKPGAVAKLIADGLKKSHPNLPKVSVEIQAAAGRPAPPPFSRRR